MEESRERRIRDIAERGGELEFSVRIERER